MSKAKKTVYEAVAEVMGEVSKVGLAKDQQNNHQRYNFRGIDGVYNLLAPILAKAGLLVLPRVTNRHERTVSTNKGALNYVVVDMTYKLVSADDGSEIELSVCGEAFDSGDKATNKAMSAAYKYMAFQTFCIPLEGNDADLDTFERTSEIQRPEPSPKPVQNADPEIERVDLIAHQIIELLEMGDEDEIGRICLELSNDDKEIMFRARNRGGLFNTAQKSELKRIVYQANEPLRQQQGVA